MSEDDKPEPPPSRMARIEAAIKGDDEFSVGDRKPRRDPVEISVQSPAPAPPKHSQSLLHRIRKRFFG